MKLARRALMLVGVGRGSDPKPISVGFAAAMLMRAGS
jgi:hypothetical protein